MNILKNLFGGGAGNRGDKRGFYVYVRPKRCDEIVEIRVDLYNDLSQEDDSSGFFVRKLASATRCPFQAEVTLFFDKNRRNTTSDIENGEFVSAQEYAEWIAEKEAATQGE